MTRYWGALWKTSVLLHQLNAWIIDFDGGPIGAATTSTFLATNNMSTSPHWTLRPATDFPGGVDEINNGLAQNHAWFAIVINANASTNLASAIATVDAAYNGTTAISLFGVEVHLLLSLVHPFLSMGTS